MVLPRIIVLKSESNDKYLRYIQDEGQTHSFLQFTGEEIINPQAKMEVEMAKRGDGLVHLRCCYNNKYWARKSSADDWITASATETEEDHSKWSCTLFKPVFQGDDDNTVHLYHAQSGLFVCLSSKASPFTDCLYAGSKTSSSQSAIAFVDWETLFFFLPDIGSPAVAHEIYTHADGSISIKTTGLGRYWYTGDGKIQPITETPEDKFWPVKLGRNRIALKHIKSNKFLNCYENEYLSLGGSSITETSQFGLDEIVLSRETYNVNFRLSDARIYDQNVLVMSTGTATNKSEEPSTHEVKLSYKNSKSSTWNAGLSLTLGVSTTLETGIPLIAQGKIKISAEFTGSYEWGETQEEESELENTYTSTVKPKTELTVSLFSYSQKDTLYDGRSIITEMDDGMYTGINSYNFTYETEEKKL